MREWMQEMLKYYREEYSKLPSPIQEQISQINEFHEQTQIEVFQFKNPTKGIMLVTHFEDRQDCEIVVHDLCEARDCIDYIDQILADPRFDREDSEVDDDLRLYLEHDNYRTVLENFFSGNIRWIKRADPVIPRRFGSVIRMAEFGFFWYIQGNLLDISPESFVDDIIRRAKDRAERIKQSKLEKPSASDLKQYNPKSPRKKRITRHGHGTYFYPPIWIGEHPKLSFKEKATGALFQLHEGTFMSLPYKSNTLVFKKGGFIAVDEPNIYKSIEILNEIFATSLLQDIPTNSVREKELDHVSINQNNEIVGWSSEQTSMRSTIRERSYDLDIFTIKFSRETISVETLESITKKSEQITADEFMKNQILHLLDAYTHLENSEYIQGFIFSWFVLEKNLFRLWKKYLKDEEIKGRRKRSLENPGTWSAHYVLESLNFVGLMSNELYSDHNVFRQLRNKIIHEGASVDKETVEKCYELAKQVIKNIINTDVSNNCHSGVK